MILILPPWPFLSFGIDSVLTTLEYMLCFTKHLRYIPDSESLQKVKYVYEISRRWLPSLGVVDFPRKVFLVQLYYINE